MATDWQADLHAREDEVSGEPIRAAAEILSAYITELRARAAAVGKASDWMASDVSIHLYADGSGVVSIGNHRCGAFSRPLVEAIAEADQYISRDDKAEANLAIGLTADGRYSIPERSDR